MKHNFPDENTARATLDVLRLQCAFLGAAVQLKTGKAVTAPVVSKGEEQDVLANIETLQAHVDSLSAQLGDASSNAHLAAAVRADFAEQPAEVLSEQVTAQGETLVTLRVGRKPTLTERALAANGVRSMSELRAKRQREQEAKWAGNTERAKKMATVR
jgi:hypothetical protein